MKTRQLHIICILLAYLTTGCTIQKKASEEGSVSIQLSIIGHWSNHGIIQSSQDCYFVEEKPHTYFGSYDLVIDKDSIEMMQYPCKSHIIMSYKLINDTIFLGDQQVPFATVLKTNNELQFIFPDCVAHSFIKDDFERETLSLLKKNKVNSRCSIGHYTLITHFERDDSPDIDRYPPIDMPDSLYVSKIQASQLVSNKRIQMQVGNEMKWFKVTRVGWGDDFRENIPYIKVQPEDWWKEDMFTVLYRSEPMPE